MSLHVHMDAPGGVAGDMFLAAMLDAFPDLEDVLRQDLADAGISEHARFEWKHILKSGFAARHVQFDIDKTAPPTRHWRDIKQMLKEEGRPDLPIHVQVRPKMALFDGLNIDQWLNEGLMDTLNVWPTDFETPDSIFQEVNGRVPVRCTIACAADDTYEQEMWKVLDDTRFDGLTIYESDAAVWSPRWRRVMREMRGL